MDTLEWPELLYRLWDIKGLFTVYVNEGKLKACVTDTLPVKKKYNNSPKKDSFGHDSMLLLYACEAY